MIKVIIKRGSDEIRDKIMLDRNWAREHIAHFRPVIDNVAADEGIEITLTCNLEAFRFSIDYLQADEDGRDRLVQSIPLTTVINVLVTTDFLRLR